jgi:hypothetical protein
MQLKVSYTYKEEALGTAYTGKKDYPFRKQRGFI